jgi:tRNA dimethylallyltransferase
VIRAIEIIETAQVSKSDIHDTPELISPTVFCTPYDGDRRKLYEKINLRVEKMFEDGLVDEVRSLRDRSPDAP